MCDIETHSGEKPKESCKILAYPYSNRASLLVVLSAFISVHRRPIFGFDFHALL